MNIIEAIKSGKKLKRRPWKKKWIDPKDTGYHITLTFQDLAANDWEVEAAPVQITREQLYTAYSEAMQEVYDMTNIKPNAGVIKLIYQKLGL